MVIADVKLAVKSSCNLLRRTSSSYKSTEELIPELTHLYLQEKEISVVEDLSAFKNVTVLYLQDNLIEKIKNVDGLINLTHLYLQNNKITRIENVKNLVNLEKLYLSHNRIAVVENLEFNKRLTELYVDNQNIDPNEQLLFDPRTLKSISGCLRVLDVSSNNLDTVSGLNSLNELEKLHARDNKISDLQETAKTLSGFFKLTEVDFSSNPITKDPHYRKKLIPSGLSLTILDGKEISPSSKNFLRRLQNHTIAINKSSKSKVDFRVEVNESGEETNERKKVIADDKDADKIIRMSLQRTSSRPV